LADDSADGSADFELNRENAPVAADFLAETSWFFRLFHGWPDRLSLRVDIEQPGTREN
jgi:hypothetical protein